jgi:hypothetical protein
VSSGQPPCPTGWPLCRLTIIGLPTSLGHIGKSVALRVSGIELDGLTAHEATSYSTMHQPLLPHHSATAETREPIRRRP